MFEKGLHIGVGLGVISLSVVVWIAVLTVDAIEYEDEPAVFLILGFALIVFMGNGIGLILRKKWALITSSFIIAILCSLLIFVIITESDGVEEDYYNIGGVLFAALFTAGSLLLLNNNTVKKEFNQEVIHDDLDDILDA